MHNVQLYSEYPPKNEEAIEIESNSAYAIHNTTEDNKPDSNYKQTSLGMIVCQIRALVYKNIAFQMKQKLNNIFEILAPLICVFAVWVIQKEIQSEFNEGFNLDIVKGIPFFMNMPFSFLDKSSAYPISSKDCNIWIMYNDSRRNMGTHNDEWEAKSVLRNHFTELCSTVKKPVPYFVESHKEMNPELLRIQDVYNNQNLNFGFEAEHIDLLPDAAVTINALNSHKIDVDIQVNDSLNLEFHRSNGYSKQSFKMPKKSFSMFSDKPYNFTEEFNKAQNMNEKEDEAESNKQLTSIDRMFKNTEETFPVSLIGFNSD